MPRYLISFPSSVMRVPEAELPEVVSAAHAVVREAKAAGVFVFAGGLDDGVAPVRVAGDGTLTDGSYPETRELSGGFAVVQVPSRDVALEWAARFAAACRCVQEVRAFMDDPPV